MLYESDDGGGRLVRLEDISAVEGAAIGDAFELLERVEGFFLGDADFDAGGVGGGLLEFGGRAGGDDLAVVDDGDAVAEALGFFDVVSGEDDGFLFATKLFDDVVDFAADLRVEAGGGLIEEEDFGVVDEGHGEGEALFLAAGQLGVEGVALFVEAEALEELFGVAMAVVEAGEEFEGFHDAELVGKRGGLEGGTDFVAEAVGIALGIEAADGNFAGVEGAEAFEDFDGGGLAGAVGAKEAEDFAFVDLKADAADGFDVTVAFDQIFDRQNGCRHRFWNKEFTANEPLALAVSESDAAASRGNTQGRSGTFHGRPAYSNRVESRAFESGGAGFLRSETGAMSKRIREFLRSDAGVLVLIALAFVAFHMATNGRYGFHRDELQTLDDARHMDWGFVAYPPITPLAARLELMLFGTSLIGFRVLSVLAVSAVMVIAGLITKELGGRRHLQALTAVAVAVSPFSLIQGAVLQYVSFDYLWGVLAMYFVVRLLKSDDARWWVAIGTALGLGMETRYTMGFLTLGLVAGLLLTPARKYLLSKWLWIGVAISVVLFLPNVVWQWRHHFISLDFLSYLHVRDVRQGRNRGFYVLQLTNINPAALLLTLLGLWFYFVRAEGKRYRMVGWTFAVTFLLFAIAKARSYYTAPEYPMLVAAGSVLLGIWLDGIRPVWARIVYGAQWVLLAAGAILFALLVTPDAPFGSPVWHVTAKMHDQFREEIGWPELAENVAGVFATLTPEERSRTGILTGNYGEAGALNLYGPALGLPHAMAGNNSFWLRGYDPREPQTVVLVGFDLDEGEELFNACTVAAKNTNPYGVVNEESKDHPDILLCRGLKKPWPTFWSEFRRFG